MFVKTLPRKHLLLKLHYKTCCTFDGLLRFSDIIELRQRCDIALTQSSNALITKFWIAEALRSISFLALFESCRFKARS